MNYLLAAEQFTTIDDIAIKASFILLCIIIGLLFWRPWGPRG